MGEEPQQHPTVRSDRRAGAKTRPSIYDVARVAGVSHMTVSRVLNGHPNIKESTRSRVMLAIEEMNYTRSSIARALATRRAMRIGVIVDSAGEFGPSSTLMAIQHAAREEGYAVSAFTVGAEPDTGIRTGITELTSQGVDALCVVAPRAASVETMRDADLGVPTLVIQSETDPTPNQHTITVAVDQRAGARMAVEHLITLGHTSIAHLSGPLDWLDARARQASVCDTLTAAGLPLLPSVGGNWTADSGFVVGLRHEIVTRATAIFAGNDQMALGLVHGLTRRGLRVPEDISVVGFDDLPDARHFLPPLTTVNQDFAALGALSVRRLVGAINGEPVRQDRIVPRLVVRESTAPPRA